MQIPSRAQTNGQLFVQLRDTGCSPQDLRLLRDTYLLAMQLYAGMFTGSGKCTLAHEVGTASLAHRHGGSIDLVAAALVHGAYIVGDWGHYRAHITAEKRAALRQVIGTRAESYVHGLALLPWDATSIAALADGAHARAEVERNVALLKLVEVLDHLLDFGAILFFRDAEKVKADLRQQRPHLCRLASRLGFQPLSLELEEAIDLTLAADLPAELLGLPFPGNAAPSIVPGSCRRRSLLRLYRRLSKGAIRASHLLSRFRSTCRLAAS